jgi:hypothetical protein
MKVPMSTPQPHRVPSREALRQQWLQHAASAFERMFADDRQEQLITFAQREQCACDLGDDLAAWLIEQHAARDPAVRPAADAPPACPKCGQAAHRLTPEDGPLPERQLTTSVGDVGLQREQWRCPTCRISFFPSGPQAAPGDGRV